MVGAGVAGALVAWRLAESGHEVVLFEAGPEVNRVEAVERFRSSVKRGLDSPYPPTLLAPVPSVDDWESHLRQQGPELFMGVYQRLVGGTTWHWLGTALRLLPEDFRMQSEFGVGVDWPISYQDLEHWYGKAEQELGVSGDSGRELGSPRSGAYPMPAIKTALVDRCFEDAVPEERELFVDLPQARNSVPYDGRPRCCGSASCIPICPIGAKYDASVHVKKALEAGATLRAETLVTRLETGLSGRVERLYYMTAQGERGWDSGDLIVVAAHAVESACLLLRSGLSNSSDQVGRNLMGASAQLSWGLSPRAVYPYRAPQATSGCMKYRGGSSRRKRAGFLTTISTDGWPQYEPEKVASTFIRQGLKGQKLKAAVVDHVSRQVALVSTCEQLPNPANRVTPTGKWLDSAGLPRPAIRFEVGPYSDRGVEESRQFHQTLLEALKADEITHSPAADPAYNLGTTRMGHNPSTSVVDSNLRSHDHSNLYLVGSQVFPTSGTAPPTLTVAALALRLAEHILSTSPERSSRPVSSS